ncbi:sodium/calcium exchanger regulatory protein 1-like [Argonauta hians]
MVLNLCGKWKIVSSENFDEYMKAAGVSDENRAVANDKFSASSNLCQEIGQSGAEWSLKTITSLGERGNTFSLGQEFSSATLDGRPVKVTFSVEGDTLVERQVGDTATSTIKRYISGDSLVMTMVSSGAPSVVCTRKYEKV